MAKTQTVTRRLLQLCSRRWSGSHVHPRLLYPYPNETLTLSGVAALVSCSRDAASPATQKNAPLSAKLAYQTNQAIRFTNDTHKNDAGWLLWLLSSPQVP